MGNTVAIASGGGNFDALLAEFAVEHIRIDQRRRPLNLLSAILQFRRAIGIHPVEAALLAGDVGV
jgi:hypothetical protein